MMFAERLKDLLSKATPEWSASRTDMDSFTGNPEKRDGNAYHVAYLYRDPDQRSAFFGDHNRDDLALIVYLRKNAPVLLKVVEAANKAVAVSSSDCPNYAAIQELRKALSALENEPLPDGEARDGFASKAHGGARWDGRESRE